MNVAGAPRFELLSTPSEDRYGGSLVFTGSERVTFYDADNTAGEGSAPTQLRFGVRIGASYAYATASTSGLNGTDSYYVIGAYDGAGGVRLFVDDVQGTAATTSGGVVQNDVPVLLGADPQGTADARFFFQGKIQQALVQRWGPH